MFFANFVLPIFAGMIVIAGCHVMFNSVEIIPSVDPAAQHTVRETSTSRSPAWPSYIDFEMQIDGLDRKPAPALLTSSVATSHDVTLVCGTQKEVSTIAELAKRNKANPTLWGDKGVWSTDPAFTPPGNLKLFRPVHLVANNQYLWGVSTSGTGALMVAKTGIQCDIPVPTQAAKSLNDHLTETALAVKTPKGSALGSEMLQKSTSVNPAYAALIYVSTMISKAEAYSVKPNTFHFRNVQDVSLVAKVTLQGFTELPKVYGSAIDYIAQEGATVSGLLERNPSWWDNKVSSDFTTLPPFDKTDPLKAESSSEATAASDDASQANMRIAALEAEVKELRTKAMQAATPAPVAPVAPVKVPVPALVKVPTPVATPTTPIVVDGKTLERNIAGAQ